MTKKLGPCDSKHCRHERKNIYSARIGIGYRALGRRDGEDIIWFWIGPHSEYGRLT